MKKKHLAMEANYLEKDLALEINNAKKGLQSNSKDK